MKDDKLIVIIALIVLIIVVFYISRRCGSTQSSDIKPAPRDVNISGNLTVLGSPTNLQDVNMSGDLYVTGSILTVYKNEYHVYANAETGDDSNGGLAYYNPVATIAKAISLLRGFTGETAFIHLGGTVPFSPGSELDFQEVASHFAVIVVEGSRKDVVNDVILSTSAVGGPFNSWRSATGTTGGYSVDQYRKGFVHNVTKNRFYVVETNSANQVFAIIGSNQARETVSDGKEPFAIGDEMTLFNVDSEIVYSTNLDVLAHSGKVVFRSVKFSPTGDVTCTLPNSAHKVRFQGCVLNCSSPGDSYRGYMELEGIYSFGLIPIALFIALSGSSNVRSESWWMDGVGIVLYTDATLLYLKQNNATSIGVRVYGGNFIGYSLDISESQLGCINFVSCTYHISTCNFTQTTSSYAWVVGFDDACIGVMGTVNVTSAYPVGPAQGIHVADSLVVRFTGVINITGVLNGIVSSTAGISEWLAVDLQISCSGLPISLAVGTNFTISPTVPTVITAPATFPVILAIGAQVHLYGVGSLYQWGTTSSNKAVIELRKGSRCHSASVLTGTFLNTGLGSAVKVGANPLGPYAQQSDFGAVTPDFCILTNGSTAPL